MKAWLSTERLKRPIGFSLLLIGLLFGVQELTKTWLYDVSPTLNFTTLQVSHILPSSKTALLAREELRGLEAVILSQDGTENLRISIALNGGAPPVYPTQNIQLSQGNYRLQGHGTFLYKGTQLRKIPLAGSFEVTGDGPVTLAFE